MRRFFCAAKNGRTHLGRSLGCWKCLGGARRRAGNICLPKLLGSLPLACFLLVNVAFYHAGVAIQLADSKQQRDQAPPSLLVALITQAQRCWQIRGMYSPKLISKSTRALVPNNPAKVGRCFFGCLTLSPEKTRRPWLQYAR